VRTYIDCETNLFDDRAQLDPRQLDRTLGVHVCIVIKQRACTAAKTLAEAITHQTSTQVDPYAVWLKHTVDHFDIVDNVVRRIDEKAGRNNIKRLCTPQTMSAQRTTGQAPYRTEPRRLRRIRPRPLRTARRRGCSTEARREFALSASGPPRSQHSLSDAHTETAQTDILAPF